MKLKIDDLKTERQWRATTGCAQAQFEKLLVFFTASYLSRYGHSVAVRQTGLAVTPSLSSEAELLFFTLFSLKAGLTYDVLGFVAGMDNSNAKRNQQLGVPVLQDALAAAGCLPAREFKDTVALAEYLKNEDTLIFDGTEQRTQRPGDAGAQQDNYAGKKNATRSRPSF